MDFTATALVTANAAAMNAQTPRITELGLAGADVRVKTKLLRLAKKLAAPNIRVAIEMATAA